LSDDEPIADATFSLAAAAQQLLTVAEALGLQYGEATARGALLVAYAVLGERALGTTIRVTRGVLTDHIGEIASYSGPERVRIMFMLMGRDIEVSVSINDVAVLNNAATA
jgi:hypothetical protein